jgi:hypothetical protein
MPSTLRMAEANVSRMVSGRSVCAWLPLRSWITTIGERLGTAISILTR